jgi:sister chromatid cohesion protein DCC1
MPVPSQCREPAVLTRIPSLSIKSQPPSSMSGPTSQPAYAVLCTPNASFQLRQVQTSNNLFVTRPTLEAHGNEIPVPTTCAIASCSATLELHPSDGSAMAYFQDVLPLYDLVDGEVDAAGNGKCKDTIFPDIPLSEGQCEHGWRELMAFEFAGSSWRPSASTLSQVWKSINAAALAEGVKLDSQFLTDDVANAVAEEGFPASLAVAILQRLSTDDQERDGPWSCLDRNKTVAFVGKSLLGARRRGSDYLTADFLDAWKDCLPEMWRKDAELKAIAGVYNLPTSTTVGLKDSAVAAAKAEPPKAAASSRKWHEKFGRTRQK